MIEMGDRLYQKQYIMSICVLSGKKLSARAERKSVGMVKATVVKVIVAHALTNQAVNRFRWNRFKKSVYCQPVLFLSKNM